MPLTPYVSNPIISTMLMTAERPNTELNGRLAYAIDASTIRIASNFVVSK